MAIEAPETKKVDSPIVACDGGEGALGHPRVYLNMEGKGEIQCPYCGRLYILEGDAHHAHAH
ncbi:MAG: zinc-finger domain-containing protein [Zavarzinia sp.]|nr:zinc-finger domain-containing protein [Zavarzinia sp.]